MQVLKSYQNTTQKCFGYDISIGQEGIPVNFLNPDIDELKSYFTVERIAFALASNIRYRGEGRISVAQHCVNMADAFMMIGEPEKAYQALLHELAEVVLGDISGPLKKQIKPILKPIEEKLETMLCSIYSCTYPFHEDVHTMDRNAAQQEMYMMYAVSSNPYPQFWDVELAQKMFIFTYWKIKNHLDLYNKKELLK